VEHCKKKVHSTEQMPLSIVNNTKLNDSENVTEVKAKEKQSHYRP
jgi:hypothetical protein